MGYWLNVAFSYQLFRFFFFVDNFSWNLWAYMYCCVIEKKSSSYKFTFQVVVTPIKINHHMYMQVQLVAKRSLQYTCIILWRSEERIYLLIVISFFQFFIPNFQVHVHIIIQHLMSKVYKNKSEIGSGLGLSEMSMAIIRWNKKLEVTFGGQIYSRN